MSTRERLGTKQTRLESDTWLIQINVRFTRSLHCSFTGAHVPMPSLIECLERKEFTRIVIHLHVSAIDDACRLPANVCLIPTVGDALSCFRYRSLFV